MGAALGQQPVDLVRANLASQLVQFGSLLLQDLAGFRFSLPVCGFSEHIVVLLARVDQQGIDLSQLADELFDDRESLVCAVAFGGFSSIPGVGKKFVGRVQALYECFDLSVALRECIYLPFCGFDFMLSLLPIRLRPDARLAPALCCCAIIASRAFCSFMTLNCTVVRCSSVLPRSPRSTSV